MVFFIVNSPVQTLPNLAGTRPATSPWALQLLAPGSCPAKPDGPVPDGVQLNTLVQNPRANGAPPAGNNGAVGQPQVPPTQPATTQAPPPVPVPSPAPAPAATGFALRNGQAAKALNAQFASLTPGSACTDGQNACVGTGFAQCIGGKFAITQCAGGTVCAALPLVNKPGTSITCTTTAERDARIANTGA